MQTTDINFPDGSIYYETCDYELSTWDKKNIGEAQKIIKENPNIFSINYYFRGEIKLYSDTEDCNISWVLMTVYNDSVYLKMTEKHSEGEYEICIDENYLNQIFKEYAS